jgi:predicted enzyme related to lactoylglutathione lyase
MSNADIRGRFVWHELMTTDTKAAGAFYPKVTAWRTQLWDKDPSYTLWVSGKGPFGGVRTLPDAARAAGPHWLPYIGTPDVDATVQTAQRLGARVTMGATDIPDTGRMAVLADPQGAAFALYSSGAGSQAGSSSPASQEFSWHELTTSDPIAALRFYGELFGWQEVGKHDMGPMGIYHLAGLHGVASIGMFKIPADKPTPTQWMCYAHVADVDKSANAAKAAGGKLVHGPMEVPGGTWIAHLVDPQGALFAVHADKRAAVTTPAAQPAKAAAPRTPSVPPPVKPSPPTPGAPANAPAPTATPAKPKPSPTVGAAVSGSTASHEPTAAKGTPGKKAAAKKAPAKAATKKTAKKAAKKKTAAKKRPKRKSRTAAKRTPRKSAAKRKNLKKRGTSRRRRSSPGGFSVARRFAVKQADSLLKRLRGRKHR